MNAYTIIVNTYPHEHREEDLKRILHALNAQTYKKFSLLLIENNSDEKELKSFLNAITTTYDIRILADPKKRLSYLFNLGWKNAETEFLAYLADDAEPEKDWLKNIHRSFDSEKKIGVVTGPIISTCFPAGEMHRLYLASRKNIILKILAWPYLHFAMEDQVLSPGKLFESGAYSIGAGLEESRDFPIQEIDLATTSSMGIRRSVISKIRGFDELFSFNHADGDLFIRIKKAGYKIIFDPGIVALHHVRQGPSRNAYNIGIDTGLYYRKHIRPHTLNGWIGLVLNVLVLQGYWVMASLNLRDVSQLKGLPAFLIGFFSRSPSK